MAEPQNSATGFKFYNMKLAKHYLNLVANADNLQTIASIFFFILFMVILIWVIFGEKKMYAENGNMPLKEDELVDNFDNNSKIE